MSTQFAACPAGNPADRDETENGRLVDVSTAGTSIMQCTTSCPRYDVTVVRVAGEIDLSTAARLGEKLSRACASASSVPSATLVVDLSAVTFFAATGIATLLAAQAAAGKSNRRLVLITRKCCVDRILEITELSASFHRAGSLAAVLADVTPGYAGPTPGYEAAV